MSETTHAGASISPEQADVEQKIVIGGYDPEKAIKKGTAPNSQSATSSPPVQT